MLQDRFAGDPDMKGREGGFLCVTDAKGQPLLIAQIGRVKEEKLAQYYRNALEKAQRLSYTTRYAGHTLSRESRDGNRERWIGATVGNLHILSFSGYPEDMDEIFMLLLAVAVHELPLNTARTYAVTAGNKYFKQLDDLFT